MDLYKESGKIATISFNNKDSEGPTDTGYRRITAG